MEEEEAIPVSKTRGVKRERPADIADTTMAEGRHSSKKMKIDHEEQVSNLFAAQVKTELPEFDMQQKKLVFKIVNNLKDNQNKCTLDDMWKRFMQMNERETNRKGTDETLISSKD